MLENFVDSLSCPYCGSAMEVEGVFTEHKGSIVNGITKCPCSRFPIVDSILVMRKNMRLELTVNMLEKGEHHDALLSLISGGRDAKMSYLFLELPDVHIPFYQIFSKFLLKYKKFLFRNYFDEAKPTFYEALDIWRLSWGDYLKHRFSNPTFLAAVPLIKLTQEPGEFLLDFGCGMGHTSFVMSKFAPEKQIVCVDYKFSNLFLAKEHIVDKGIFICVDGNAPLPFRENFFSAILCSDALHYIKSKQLALNECKRVVSVEGVLLFSHLHNSLCFNPEAGWPLTPEAYANLFDGLNFKMLSEEKVLDDLLNDDKLDLANKDHVDIDKANAISIVASNNDNYFKMHTGILDSIFSGYCNFTINPIYKRHYQANKIVLTRHFPSVDYENEHVYAKKYLPEKYIVDRHVLESIDNKKIDHDPITKEMMNNFILLCVPDKYI